jgi:hypothetical protein
MKTLEQKTETRSKGDICISFYKVKMHPVVSEEQIHCLNCGGYETNKECYRQSRNYYVLLNQGKPALIFR